MDRERRRIAELLGVDPDTNGPRDEPTAAVNLSTLPGLISAGELAVVKIRARALLSDLAAGKPSVVFLLNDVAEHFGIAPSTARRLLDAAATLAGLTVPAPIRTGPERGAVSIPLFEES